MTEWADGNLDVLEGNSAKTFVEDLGEFVCVMEFLLSGLVEVGGEAEQRSITPRKVGSLCGVNIGYPMWETSNKLLICPYK